MLQVHTRNGKKTHGVFTTWADDRIRLMQGNTQVEVARSEIVRIFHLAGDTEPWTAKVAKGSRRVGDMTSLVWPIVYLAMYAQLPGVAIGALAAGVAGVILMYVLPKGGVKGVLLFAQ
jgi:hypothetical protein